MQSEVSGQRSLCDKRVAVKLKGNFHGAVVRSALLNGSNFWVVEMGQKRRRQLWKSTISDMSGGGSLGRVRLEMRNEYSKGIVGVAHIGTRWWFAHVM